MTPGNRRVKKPELPPEMLEAGGIDDVDPLEEAVPLGAPRRSTTPKPPQTRAGRIVTYARAIIGVALVLALSTAVAWAARRHVMKSSRFAVAEIDVTGARHLTPEQIEKESGLLRGTNVFSVDLDVARAKLIADPWIADATFARRLPGTILIQVTEREAGALVALGDTYVATREGEIFKKLEVGDPDDLPIVTGLLADAVTNDREGARRSIRRAIDLSAEYATSALAKKATLQEIHVAPGGGITLIVGKSTIALRLGDPPFRRKLDEAARVLAELEKRSAKADMIMLDNEARPERVVVRVR